MANIKKIHTIIVVSLFVLLMVPGCTKNSDPNPSMTATINNAAFAVVGYRVVCTGGPGTMTNITGTNLPVGNAIPTSINISVCNVVKTYQFNSPFENSCVTIYLSSAATGGMPVRATSGQVHVTNSSAHYIQGTFNFNVEDSTGTYVIANGQFRGKY